MNYLINKNFLLIILMNNKIKLINIDNQRIHTTLNIKRR